jgi:hypothetical protein
MQEVKNLATTKKNKGEITPPTLKQFEFQGKIYKLCDLDNEFTFEQMDCASDIVSQIIEILIELLGNEQPQNITPEQQKEIEKLQSKIKDKQELEKKISQLLITPEMIMKGLKIMAKNQLRKFYPAILALYYSDCEFEEKEYLNRTELFKKLPYTYYGEAEFILQNFFSLKIPLIMKDFQISSERLMKVIPK